MLSLFDERKSTPQEEAAYISNLSKLAFALFLLGKIQCFTTAICVFFVEDRGILWISTGVASLFIVASIVLALIDNNRFKHSITPSEKEILQWAAQLGLELKQKNT